MITNDALERRLADHYATEAPRRAPDRLLRSALAAVDAVPQRRRLVRPRLPVPVLGRSARLAIAGLIVIALVASGLALIGPSPTPVPSVAPTPTINPLIWTPDSLGKDWPLPIRPEPIGGAPGVAMVGRTVDEGFDYFDTVGDVGPDLAWLDISEASVGYESFRFGVHLAADQPQPVPDPATRWIAYGVVLDTNGDGTADVRIGMDNTPSLGYGTRAWRTDLASGVTTVSKFEWYFPGDEFVGPTHALLRYGLKPGEEDFRFYAWASLIEGGRAVATDFAPDAGWLKQGVPRKAEVPLVGTTWNLWSNFSSGGQDMSIVETLTFSANGTVAIDAGCYAGEGIAAVEPDRLRISELDLTDVACSSAIAALDAELTILTADAIEYEIVDGILKLKVGEILLQLQSDPDGYIDIPR